MKIDAQLKRLIELRGWPEAQKAFERGSIHISPASFADQVSAILTQQLSAARNRARIDKDEEENAESIQNDLASIRVWKNQRKSLLAVARRLKL